MAASTSTSLIVSTTLIILLTASMQLYKSHLASGELMTIIGGFLGSLLFVFILTAIGNLEKLAFGQGFQTKIFPEVVSAQLIAMFASSLIHRVAVTVCFLLSLVFLYYINRVSQSLYSLPPASANIQIKKKK